VNEPTIIIPFGDKFLVLTPDQFREAMKKGQELITKPSIENGHPKEIILDADGMNEETGIPPTWFLEQARQNKIPHLRAGKYVRFKLSEVIGAIDRKNIRGRSTK